MANRTDTQADTVHGGNPQYLVDRIVRLKIHNDAYWKEHCFALTTESLIDRAAEIDYVAGTYGGRRRPAKFLCLLLKMLQIQPDEDVVMEYIKQPQMKYLRALGILYLRLVSKASTVYNTLEPLFADYRKLRYRDIVGKMSIIHMDEFVDWCLREETVCDVTMPALPRRQVLELSIDLAPYHSVLEDDLEDLEELEQQMMSAAIVADPVTTTGVSDGATASGGGSKPEAGGELVEGDAGAPVDTGNGKKGRRRSTSCSSNSSRSAVRSRSHRRRGEAKVSEVEKKRPEEKAKKRTRHDPSDNSSNEGRERRPRGQRRSRSRGTSREQRAKEERRERRESGKDRQPEKDRGSDRRSERSPPRHERANKSAASEEKRDHDRHGGKKEQSSQALDRDVWKAAEEKEARREEKRREKKEKNEKLERMEKEKWRMEKKGGKEKSSRKEESSKAKKGTKEKDGSLGVDEWNDVRKQLGLKPLKG